MVNTLFMVHTSHVLWFWLVTPCVVSKSYRLRYHLLRLDKFTFMKTYPETLYHRDNALLYIAYVMLIWAEPIPADRWHCSLWP